MRDLLSRDGFAFVPAGTMQSLLQKTGSLDDWHSFSESWDHLVTDNYMADKGRYRKRRYAVFSVDKYGKIEQEPHQPHFQSVDYNPLNGGIERWFEPLLPLIGKSKSLGTILAFCHQLFGALLPDVLSWHIEVHQFRIEARLNQSGKPTPEGMHRDGVDYVLVLLIHRQNIDSGITTIHDLQHQAMGNFTLTQPMDAAIVDDRRVFHGVTPVMPLDPSLPAYRDVLVVTFRRQ